jgi:hypothetical protein
VLVASAICLQTVLQERSLMVAGCMFRWDPEAIQKPEKMSGRRLVLAQRFGINLVF